MVGDTGIEPVTLPCQGRHGVAAAAVWCRFVQHDVRVRARTSRAWQALLLGVLRNCSDTDHLGPFLDGSFAWAGPCPRASRSDSAAWG
jgi:hypothetical protein